VRSTIYRIGDLIPMYRSGNILARRIDLNACSWTTPQEVFDSNVPKFPGQQGKEDYMLVTNRLRL
jgi:hypothetical protein